MEFSAESKLADIRACLDSYGLSVTKNGLLYLQCPLHFLELGPHPKTWDFNKIDESLNLRMIRYEPPTDDDFLEGIRERNHRWPFYVHQPMSVFFCLGDNWWQYSFTPDKTYVERHIDP
jgi:hypothetical protein